MEIPLLSLTEFCNWLADTSASYLFQEVLWIVAAAQSLWKMGLLLVGIVVTLIYARPLRRNPSWWDDVARLRQLASGIAITSLLIWVGIVFCGRWIEYVSPF